MSTLEDTTVLDETILNHELPCARCKTGAAWLAKCRYCGPANQAHICDRHYHRDHELITHKIKCGNCAVVGHLDDVFAYIPI